MGEASEVALLMEGSSVRARVGVCVCVYVCVKLQNESVACVCLSAKALASALEGEFLMQAQERADLVTKKQKR